MGKRVAVFPAGRQALYDRNRYSAAVASGGFLFVSGQVGAREDGSPEPDLEAQLRLAFQNLNAVLAAVGCTFDDVVDFILFVVDPEKSLSMAFKVRDEFWGEPPYPPLTAIGVTWLYGFHFELKVTARLPEGTAQ
jgi:enamine deaminase RidA (YjgF/YER057c/UK114 family)